MDAEICEHLLVTLRSRREAIADRWYCAVADTSYSSFDGAEVRGHLLELVDRASELLLAEPQMPVEARAIGAALATLHYLRPAALGRTVEVLSRELVANAPDTSLAALQPRLAALLGAVAHGYYDRARATILAEQEAARAPQVAELRRIEGALRTSEARLRGVATNVPVMLFALDRDGVFTFAAGQGLAAIGLTPEQIVGRPVFALFAEVPRLLDDVRRALAGEDCMAVAEVGAVVVEARHTPVRDESGTITGAIGVAFDITARMEAEAALRRARDFNAAILDTAGSLVVVLDRQGGVVRFNRACERLTGYTFDEVRGQPFWEIFLLPDERARVEGVFATLCAGHYPNEHENHWITKAGERRLIAWANTALPDGAGVVAHVVGIGIDVTERRRAEAALGASEARFRAIFDSVTIGIALADPGGQLVESNRALCEMLGYDADELRGMPFLQITHPDGLTSDLQQYRALLAGEIAAYQLEKRYVRKDGAIIQGRLTISLVRDAGGALRYAIGMVQDISAHKQAAAERDEARRRLLVSREAAQGELARELHDGPLQDLFGVTFQLDALVDALPDAASRAQLAAGLVTLERVAGDLRIIGRELRPPMLAPFGLAAMIRAHARRVQEARPDLTIHLDLASDWPPLAELEQMALFRIVQEARRNAVQHAEARTVWVRLGWDATAITAEVRDDGAGFVPPPQWTVLVERGHLGLAGAVERTEALGGWLIVESAPGRGTTVRAVIPSSTG